MGGSPVDQPPAPARPETPLEFLPVSLGASPTVRMNIHPSMLAEVEVVPFDPAPESHLLDLNNSHETPAEEFRTLRTRLNHLQTLQPLHTAIVTSPSPAEGKTFTAVNLALAEAQLISICAGPSSTTCSRSSAHPGYPTTWRDNAPSRRRSAKWTA
jgi:hypothetical protein